MRNHYSSANRERWFNVVLLLTRPTWPDVLYRYRLVKVFAPGGLCVVGQNVTKVVGSINQAVDVQDVKGIGESHPLWSLEDELIRRSETDQGSA